MATVKAVRATILLGEIPLNVYQMPDETYRLAGRNVTDAVEKHMSSLPEKWGSRSLKALQYKGLNLPEVKAETGEKLIAIPFEMAVEYWADQAQKGNIKAINILTACAIESLERRADAEFNKQRTEEERNALMSARIEGKQTRRQLTDAIRDYLDRHPEVSDNHRHWMYSNASEAVNLVVFGKKAKKLALELNAPKHDLRSHMTIDQLELLREVENTAIRLIDKLDRDPLSAIKECSDRLLISVEN